MAWKDVCVPKQEGGLGLKSLRCWNKTLMSYHIWNIVSNKSSLWGKWVHEYRIKGRSFWDIKEAWDSSWSWKNILKLRKELRPFIRMKVRSGQSTNFLFDAWALSQPFYSFCSHRYIVEMGSSKLAKVVDFFHDGLWEWPDGILQKIPQLQGVQPRISLEEDRAVWISRRGL